MIGHYGETIAEAVIVTLGSKLYFYEYSEDNSKFKRFFLK